MDDAVFHVASTAYTWWDVLDWGRRQEAWGDHVREVREGVAALTLARREGSLLAGEVAAAAAAFRRRHGLISAEDTERWLAQRRLSLSAFRDHIRRGVARQRHRQALAGLDVTGSEVDDEAARRWATGVCSGLYAALAAGLAERAAASDARAETAGAPAGDPGPGPDRWEVLEAAYRDFRRAAATDRAVTEEVMSRRLEWIDFDVEWISFPEEAAAREALLCLREEGDFSAVLPALPAAAPPVRRRGPLCDFDPGLRAGLIGARTGDALGPVRTAEGWRVTRVLTRRVPAVEDAEVRRRAAAAVAARAVRREVERRVRWRERY